MKPTQLPCGFTLTKSRILFQWPSILRLATKWGTPNVDLLVDKVTKHQLLKRWLKAHKLRFVKRTSGTNLLNMDYDSYTISKTLNLHVITDQWFDDVRRERLKRGWRMIALIIDYPGKRAHRITFLP